MAKRKMKKKSCGGGKLDRGRTKIRRKVGKKSRGVHVNY